MAYYRKSRKYRGKTGVIRSKKSYTAYDKIRYVRGVKQPQNKMGAYGRAPTLAKVITLINKKMGSMMENKRSDNHEYTTPIATWGPGAGVPVNWFHYPFTNFFDVNPGAGEFQRIGNRFKLKRWIIKGLIHPNAMEENNVDLGQTAWSNTFLRNSYAGKVTVFLGKITNGEATTQNLPAFWQNGATSITPTGTVYDQLYTVNNDVYKIYWKQSFNVGLADIAINQYGVSNTVNNQPNGYLSVNTLPNNDLKLKAQFYIDVTKLIGKNATIKFNDNSTQAIVPSSLRGLALWAVWSPFNGNLTQASATAANNSFYSCYTTSFFEYEDA